MAMRRRVVEPEILDALSADHPDAVAARRDLRLINALMGNFRWLARGVEAAVRPGERVLELGAGDGGLARALRRRMPGLAGRYAALDRAPRPGGWPADFHWVQADLFSNEGAAALARADVVVANLFLHHFEEVALARIGALLAPARLLLFCEPARRAPHVWQGRLLAAAARFNRVTRHDLPVSVRAGFRGGELVRALGLAADAAGGAGAAPERVERACRVDETLLGAHRLAAVRR